MSKMSNEIHPVPGFDEPVLLLWASLHDVLPSGAEQKALAFLPPEESAAIAANRRKQDRRLRLLVRLLLAEGLFLLEGRPLERALGDLERSARGRPMVRGGRWQCSFSHSHELALCLIGRTDGHGRLGVDAERVQALGLEDVGAAFCARERDHIASARNARQRLFELWTRKEAVLKALGSGFLRDPSTLSVLSSRPDGLPKDDPMPELWTANITLTAFPGYAVALAVEHGPVSALVEFSPYAGQARPQARPLPAA